VHAAFGTADTGAGGQVHDGPGNEDLAWRCCVLDPLGDVHGDAGDVVAADLDLADMDTRPDDGADRVRLIGRRDDVGEQHRGEPPVIRRGGRHAGHELGDASDHLDPIGPVEQAPATRELHERGTGDATREVAPEPDGHEGVVDAMEHGRRHPDRSGNLAEVALEDHRNWAAASDGLADARWSTARAGYSEGSSDAVSAAKASVPQPCSMASRTASASATGTPSGKVGSSRYFAPVLARISPCTRSGCAAANMSAYGPPSSAASSQVRVDPTALRTWRRSSAQSSHVGSRSVLRRSDAPVPRRSNEITLASEPSTSRLVLTEPMLQRRSTCELKPSTNVRPGP
jgi:hypothetical protein